MFDPHHNAVARYYLVNGSWNRQAYRSKFGDELELR